MEKNNKIQKQIDINIKVDTNFASELKLKLLNYIGHKEVIEHNIHTIDGFQNINVLTTGRGTPLLLLHDIGVTPELYGNLINYLKREHMVIVPAFPGHGSTSLWQESYFANYDTKQIYTSFLNSILNHFEVNEPVSIVGHSFGASLAVLFASEHPEKVANLKLISVAARPYKLSLSQHIQGYYEFLKHNGEIPFYIIWDLFKNLGAYIKSYRFILNIDLMKELKRVTSKTQIFWGEKDNLVPRQQADIITKMIKNSSLKIIKDRHHNWLFDSPNLLS